MITSFEAKELLKAYLATSLAFGILIWDYGENLFWWSFALSAITVGLGFVLHELGHRYVAHRYKKLAEFRANNQMLVISILISFSGVLIAAPGAVLISGFVNKKESGHISAAGPLVNLVLAVLFIPLVFFVPKIGYYGFMINALLGLFNLIPIPGFDGEKVIRWSKPAYFTMVGFALLLNLLTILFQNFMII